MIYDRDRLDILIYNCLGDYFGIVNFNFSNRYTYDDYYADESFLMYNIGNNEWIRVWEIHNHHFISVY